MVENLQELENTKVSGACDLIDVIFQKEIKQHSVFDSNQVARDFLNEHIGKITEIVNKFPSFQRFTKLEDFFFHPNKFAIDLFVFMANEYILVCPIVKTHYFESFVSDKETISSIMENLVQSV